MSATNTAIECGLLIRKIVVCTATHVLRSCAQCHGIISTKLPKESHGLHALKSHDFPCYYETQFESCRLADG